MPRGGVSSCCRYLWRLPRLAPMASSSRFTRTPTRRSATGRRRCARRSSRSTRSRCRARRRWPEKRSLRGSRLLPDLSGAELRPADYVRDRRIERVVPLLAPDALLQELPLSGEQADVVIRGRREVQAVLDGVDERLLVVVGPCSVHDPEATLE